jgi:hypothetical protein
VTSNPVQQLPTLPDPDSWQSPAQDPIQLPSVLTLPAPPAPEAASLEAGVVVGLMTPGAPPGTWHDPQFPHITFKHL